jgi:hypothetical protein
MRILQRFDIPVVYTIRSLAAYHAAVMKNPEEMPNNIDDQVELMGRSRRVVLLTQDILDIARRHHPEHGGRFTVIENGTHPPAETPDFVAARASLAARLRARRDERIILYVGRISREKGIYLSTAPQTSVTSPQNPHAATRRASSTLARVFSNDFGFQAKGCAISFHSKMKRSTLDSRSSRSTKLGAASRLRRRIEDHCST